MTHEVITQGRNGLMHESRTPTLFSVPPFEIVKSDKILAFRQKESEQPPHFQIDFDSGTVVRNGVNIPPLKSDYFLDLMGEFSDPENPPTLEELEALAHSHNLMYDRPSIIAHLGNLKRRLGGGPELISSQKRETGTVFVFNGIIEFIGQDSSPQATPEKDTDLAPDTITQLIKTAEPILPKTEDEELTNRILAGAPEEMREKLSKALQRLSLRHLKAFQHVPFTKELAIKRTEWGRLIDPDSPQRGAQKLSNIIAEAEPEFKSVGLKLAHLKSPSPDLGKNRFRASYYLAEIDSLTPENIMRRILSRGPITLLDLTCELNPDAEPAIAARNTIVTLKRLNRDLKQEGLTIPVLGITLLGIMKPEYEKAAIQTFKEKQNQRKNGQEPNSGQKENELKIPEAKIDDSSPQIIVNLKEDEIFINGQIIRYKQGQNVWTAFLHFLQNPGVYFSGKEISDAVLKNAKETLKSNITSLTSAIDTRVNNMGASHSLFQHNNSKTALVAAVSFLLPGQKFPEEYEEDMTNNGEVIRIHSEEVLAREIRRRERLKNSNNLRIVSMPVQDAFDLFDIRLVIPKKKQTGQIRLDTSELSLFEEIIKNPTLPTVDTLAKAVRRNYYTVFDERGGFEKTLISLDKKIHQWGIALEIEESAGEQGEDILKITAYTPEHKLSIEPEDPILIDKIADKETGERQRRRKPSHGKQRL